MKRRGRAAEQRSRGLGACLELGVVARVALLGGLVVAPLGGCSAGAPAFTPVRLSHAQLEGEGRIPSASLSTWTRTPTRDFRQELTVAITEGVSGKGFEGRGVLAVRPGKGGKSAEGALRMVLLGPGGTTAMDVWIAGDAYRVSIPALDKVMRGDARKTAEIPRGLPIALFRRWIVAPYGGADLSAWAGRLDADGSVAPANDAGAPVRSFVSFAHRDDVFEARARIALGGGITARAWWFRGGSLVERLDAVEVPVSAESGAPIVTRALDYASTDPPMNVHVEIARTELLDEATALPPATFVDPDGG